MESNAAIDYRQLGLKKKTKKTYIGLVLFALVILLAASITDAAGHITLIAYVFVSLFIYLVFKSVDIVIIISAAVLINSALADGSMLGISIRMILLLLLIISYIKHIKDVQRKKKLIVPGWFYFLWFVFILIVNVGMYGASFMDQIPLLLLFLLSYQLQIIVKINRETADKFLIVVVMAFLFISLVCYLELGLRHTFFYSRWVGNERFRNGIMRAGSTVSDPNNVCFMLVPFIFIMETNALKNLFPKITRRIIEILLIGSIILTSSRAGLVALFVGVMIYFIAQKKVIMLLLIPALAFGLNFGLRVLEGIIGQYAESTNYRNYVLESALLEWSTHPLLGNGSSVISQLFGSKVNTMNSYVYMLICYGIIGLIFFILFLVFLIKIDLAFWFKNKAKSSDQLLKICSVVTMAIIAYTLDTFYMPLMWSFPAVFIAVNYRSKE